MFPVSVWMKKLTWEEEPRCIAVIEPVERKTAMVLFDAQVCTDYYYRLKKKCNKGLSE